MAVAGLREPTRARTCAYCRGTAWKMRSGGVPVGRTSLRLGAVVLPRACACVCVCVGPRVWEWGKEYALRARAMRSPRTAFCHRMRRSRSVGSGGRGRERCGGRGATEPALDSAGMPSSDVSAGVGERWGARGDCFGLRGLEHICLILWFT